ncbi:MAG: glycosyltransferase family 4 protein [Candidatus Eremiobacterota bacterium]
MNPRIRVAHLATVDMGLRYLLLNQMRYLAACGYEVTGISAHGPDVPFLEQAGIPHLAVPFNRRPFDPVQDLKGFWHLVHLLRRERFTILHTHNPKPTFYGQIAARLAGIPIVVNTLHGFYFHERTHPLLRRVFIAMETVAASCADVILSQNREDIDTAIQEGICPAWKVRPLGNGIDLSRFSARVAPAERARCKERLGLAATQPVVGFVGRLVREKGIPELLEACRILRQIEPELRLLLVGPSDPDKPDAIAVDEEGVLALGLRHDLPELYAAMDVCCLPSHREGYPRVPMEACAMGVPCVVTDIRGCREVVDPDVNGLRVPVKNPQALMEALRRVLHEPDRAERYAKAARRIAEERFDERRVFDTVRAEYARLLKQRGIPLPPG